MHTTPPRPRSLFPYFTPFYPYFDPPNPLISLKFLGLHFTSSLV
jgi:hypothetical protein